MRKEKPNYWIWVTRPEYYLDENGDDDPSMHPSNPHKVQLEWTCHKDTKRGDLVLLYRSRRKKDVGYLLQATSDADRNPNGGQSEKGWDYWCTCASLYKFSSPLTLNDIRSDPYLADWTANRGNFQKMVYKISSPDWKRINGALAVRNRGYKKLLSNFEGSVLPDPVVLEEEIEHILTNDLERLNKFGFNLELCSEKKDGYYGRQVICDGGHGGRIDLLCYDRKQERYIVIEIKNVRANQHTFGQIQTYIGWVQNTLHPKKSVWGIVMSRGFDARFESSMKVSRRVQQIDVSEIGFE